MQNWQYVDVINALQLKNNTVQIRLSSQQCQSIVRVLKETEEQRSLIFKRMQSIDGCHSLSDSPPKGPPCFMNVYEFYNTKTNFIQKMCKEHYEGKSSVSFWEQLKIVVDKAYCSHEFDRNLLDLLLQALKGTKHRYDQMKTKKYAKVYEKFQTVFVEIEKMHSVVEKLRELLNGSQKTHMSSLPEQLQQLFSETTTKISNRYDELMSTMKHETNNKQISLDKLIALSTTFVDWVNKKASEPPSEHSPNNSDWSLHNKINQALSAFCHSEFQSFKSKPFEALRHFGDQTADKPQHYGLKQNAAMHMCQRMRLNYQIQQYNIFDFFDKAVLSQRRSKDMTKDLAKDHFKNLYYNALQQLTTKQKQYDELNAQYLSEQSKYSSVLKENEQLKECLHKLRKCLNMNTADDQLELHRQYTNIQNTIESMKGHHSTFVDRLYTVTASNTGFASKTAEELNNDLKKRQKEYIQKEEVVNSNVWPYRTVRKIRQPALSEEEANSLKRRVAEEEINGILEQRSQLRSDCRRMELQLQQCNQQIVSLRDCKSQWDNLCNELKNILWQANAIRTQLHADRIGSTEMVESIRQQFVKYEQSNASLTKENNAIKAEINNQLNTLLQKPAKRGRNITTAKRQYSQIISEQFEDLRDEVSAHKQQSEVQKQIIEQLNAEKQSLNKEVSDLRSQNHHLANQISKLKLEGRSLAQKIEQNRQNEEKSALLTKQLESKCKVKTEELQKGLNNTRQALVNEQRKSAQLRKEERKLQNQINELRAKQQKHETAIAAKDEQIRKLNGLLSETEEHKKVNEDKLNGEISDLSEQKQKHETAIAAKDEQIRKLNGLLSETEEHKKVNEDKLNGEISDLSEQKQKHETAIAAKDEQIRKLNGLLSEAEEATTKMKEQLIDCGEQSTENAKRILDLTVERDSLQKHNFTLKVSNDKYRTAILAAKKKTGDVSTTGDAAQTDNATQTDNVAQRDKQGENGNQQQCETISMPKYEYEKLRDEFTQQRQQLELTKELLSKAEELLKDEFAQHRQQLELTKERLNKIEGSLKLSDEFAQHRQQLELTKERLNKSEESLKLNDKFAQHRQQLELTKERLNKSEESLKLNDEFAQHRQQLELTKERLNKIEGSLKLSDEFAQHRQQLELTKERLNKSEESLKLNDEFAQQRQQLELIKERLSKVEESLQHLTKPTNSTNSSNMSVQTEQEISDQPNASERITSMQFQTQKAQIPKQQPGSQPQNQEEEKEQDEEHVENLQNRQTSDLRSQELAGQPQKNLQSKIINEHGDQPALQYAGDNTESQQTKTDDSNPVQVQGQTKQEQQTTQLPAELKEEIQSLSKTKQKLQISIRQSKTALNKYQTQLERIKKNIAEAQKEYFMNNNKYDKQLKQLQQAVKQNQEKLEVETKAVQAELQKHQSLEHEISKAKNQLQEEQNKRSEVVSRNEQLSQQISQMQSEIEKLKQEIKALQDNKREIAESAISTSQGKNQSHLLEVKINQQSIQTDQVKTNQQSTQIDQQSTQVETNQESTQIDQKQTQKTEEELRKLTQTKQKLNEELSNVTQQISKSKQSLTLLNKQLKQKIQKLQQLDSTLQMKQKDIELRQQRINSHNLTIQQRNSQSDKLRKEVALLKRQVIQLNSEKEVKNQKLKKLNERTTMRGEDPLPNRYKQMKVEESVSPRQELRKDKLKSRSGVIWEILQPSIVEKNYEEQETFGSLLVGNFNLQRSHKQFILNQLENIDSYRRVTVTKLLFMHPEMGGHNFHQLVDKKQNLLLLLRLENGSVIAAYSETPIEKNRFIKPKGAFLASLTNMKSYYLNPKNQQAKSMKYDDYYIIFGNSDLRIKIGDDFAESNIPNIYQYFLTPGEESPKCLFGEAEKKVAIQRYEIYQLVFEDKQIE